ncbi:hypothetical protein [Nocardia bovistercoris]|uniref:Uncharacterized protein n=1 Tax=Nocardia bovistercoris TaxID=2785916 RepID=A0A931I801_9NOCA|nr:hypothetical protein [Nocardia bovistercoris]MBH0775786.1 hypothetical protein [Nocardia bovistercoris]
MTAPPVLDELIGRRRAAATPQASVSTHRRTVVAAGMPNARNACDVQQAR